MKRTSGMLSVLAAAIIFSAAPVRGDDTTGTDMPQVQPDQKNECLLVAMNCPDSYKSDTTDQRIDRLQKEINKGSDVYSADELQKLHDQQNQLYEQKGSGDNSSE